MLAATGYKFVQSSHLFNAQDLLALGIGLVVSFLVAWAVIAAFLTYVKRHTLKIFGYYRVVLGTIILFVGLGAIIRGAPVFHITHCTD